MKRKVPTLARVADGWTVNTDAMGVYGNDDLKHAIDSQLGLGANLPDDAIYRMKLFDSSGSSGISLSEVVVSTTMHPHPPAGPTSRPSHGSTEGIMKTRMSKTVATAATLFVLVSAAGADQQQIAPGTGQQNSVVVNAGPDGICDTTAAAGDLQYGTVGLGSPNRNEIRCGANKIVDTVAAGDDVQLIAYGASCKNTTTAIIDTGADGIADTTAASDDPQLIPVTTAPANGTCIMAGADGVAQTATANGDDTLVLAAGTAEADTAVVLCGPNGVADTTANNVTTGDDVQLVPPGNSCSPNAVVVDSGPDGIASTRAEGVDLGISAAKPTKIKIAPGSFSGSRELSFKISNYEFGAGAPASRSYRISTTAGSCGGGVSSQVDADAMTPGLQATADVPLGGSKKASVVATMKLQDVTTLDSKNHYRCTFDISVVALDTAPDVDDAVNPENNTTTVDLEVTDGNDF